jgi:ribulose 1,5-bisphosphate synthetase/thiazole synthase
MKPPVALLRKKWFDGGPSELKSSAGTEFVRICVDRDAIVVGGGHNGLVAAAYLAKVGVCNVFSTQA